jgi:hypothetical protein
VFRHYFANRRRLPPSYTGGQTRRACSDVLPVHLWKARKNEFGSSNPSKKLIPAPLMRAFFGVQVHRRD